MDDSNLSEPVLKDLKTEMRCGMFTNAEGEILIVHDQEITSPIQWIEYDEVDDSFSLIHENGHIQPLGLQLNQKMKANLLHASEVTLAHLADKKIKSSQTVVFLVKSA